MSDFELVKVAEILVPKSIIEAKDAEIERLRDLTGKMAAMIRGLDKLATAALHTGGKR